MFFSDDSVMGKWAISVVMVILLFMGMEPVMADYDRGLAAHQRGDYATSYRELQKAANQGNPKAQNLLGFLYGEGLGVAQNHTEAFRWVRSAAEQGYSLAQHNLGFIYASGRGVPKNDVLAYKWASLAAAQGHKGAQYQLDIYGRGMTREQIAEANRLAEEVPWKKAGAGDPKLASTGSGFFVNDAGHLLTNHHVVYGCALVRVGLPSGSVDGTTVASDATEDLAVIRVVNNRPGAVAVFRGTPAALGEDVIVVGYPLRSVLGTAVNVTFGAVSSTSGPGGDRRYLQITAPVQQGNSGGPLLDESGAVVGVVVAKLDALSVAIATGDIPQNINFGIKGAVARSFLSIHDIGHQVAPAGSAPAGRPVVVGAATEFTVPVECWK